MIVVARQTAADLPQRGGEGAAGIVLGPIAPEELGQVIAGLRPVPVYDQVRQQRLRLEGGRQGSSRASSGASRQWRLSLPRQRTCSSGAIGPPMRRAVAVRGGRPRRGIAAAARNTSGRSGKQPFCRPHSNAEAHAGQRPGRMRVRFALARFSPSC